MILWSTCRQGSPARGAGRPGSEVDLDAVGARMPQERTGPSLACTKNPTQPNGPGKNTLHSRDVHLYKKMSKLVITLLALVPLAASSARPGLRLETLDALQSLNKHIVLQHNENKQLPAALRAFIRLVPKAELHVHVERTLEPELMLAIAQRDELPAPYPSAEAARAA